MLEVAIGLVVVYVLFSLVGSTITEGIAQALNLRGKNLVAGIGKLFQNSGGGNVLGEFFNHPLIQSLDQSFFKRGKVICPDYISSTTFKTVLNDLLKLPEKARDAGGDLELALSKLPEGNLKVSLKALLQSAKGDLDAFEEKVESWYDEAMERVAALYKRKAHLITFVTAVLLVLAFNVDTLHYGNLLYENSNLRQSLVSVGEQISMESQGNPAGMEDQNPENLPDLSSIMDKVRSSKLPIGWSEAQFSEASESFANGLTKTLGLAISVFAISLGAPFWFQLLNKLVNLKSSGIAPLTMEERKVLANLKTK